MRFIGTVLFNLEHSSLHNFTHSFFCHLQTIRLQNQRLNDMKKTLQKEINSKTNANLNGSKTMNSLGDSSSEESGNVNSNPNTVSAYHRSDNMPPPTLAVTSPDDVNFTYMKNVVLHILTSKGTEVNF